MGKKNLPRRNKKRPRQMSAKSAPDFPAPRVQRHPKFGEIPLIPKPYLDRNGIEHHSYEFDPAYTPLLPKGAVRGDIRKQHFCPICHVPKYYYEDINRRCIQCEAEFTFTAKEQKHWYEVLQFYPDSQAVRCTACRRRVRSEKALQRQLSRVKSGLKSNPENPALLLELAECLSEYRVKFGKGDPEEGIRAARKAQKLWPNAFEAIFWEARCQLAAGRKTKADTLFTHFSETAPKDKRYSKLLASWKSGKS